ncbi:TetR/AcrR family transcriptional regulator [bacterium]|nr:TetR/AcrR family transcriptional regulator [bacterium]
MGRPSSRERILKAAETIASRDGAGHLTLDAVAQEAGVSKGGLLYHFKSKRELIAEILAAHIDAIVAACDKERDRLAGQYQTELELHLRATLESEHSPMKNREMGIALLAAVANEPGILHEVNDRFEEFEEQLWGKRSEFKADAAILWLAGHGLKFLDLMDHSPFLDGQREQVVRRLIELASDPSPLREKKQ